MYLSSIHEDEVYLCCLDETKVNLSCLGKSEVHLSRHRKGKVYLSCLAKGAVDAVEGEVVIDVVIPLRVVRRDDWAQLGVGLGVVTGDAAGGVAVQDEGLLLGAQHPRRRGGRRAVDLVYPAPAAARGSLLCLRHLSALTAASATTVVSSYSFCPKCRGRLQLNTFASYVCGFV